MEIVRNGKKVTVKQSRLEGRVRMEVGVCARVLKNTLLCTSARSDIIRSVFASPQALCGLTYD